MVATSGTRWLAFGAPFAVLFLPLAWLLLVRSVPKDAPAPPVERPGPITPAERRVAVVFGLTALLWIFRERMDLGALAIPGWTDAPLLDGSNVTDGVVALVMPHLIGAPTVSGESPVAHLERVFAAASLGTMLAFWVIMGALSGYLQDKLLAGNQHGASFARPA